MRTTLVRLAVTAAAAGAVAIAGTTAVAAATSTPSASPNAKSHPHGIFRLPKVAGAVVSESSSGGALGKGTLVIREPNGTQLTLSLTSGTKAWKYQGMGVKPVSESPTSLPQGELVIVAGRGLRGKDHLARHILDLGFVAAS